MPASPLTQPEAWVLKALAAGAITWPVVGTQHCCIVSHRVHGLCPQSVVTRLRRLGYINGAAISNDGQECVRTFPPTPAPPM